MSVKEFGLDEIGRVLGRSHQFIACVWPGWQQWSVPGFLSMVTVTNRVGCLKSASLPLSESSSVPITQGEEEDKGISGRGWCLDTLPFSVRTYFSSSNRFLKHLINEQISDFLLFSVHLLPQMEVILSNEIDAYYQTYIGQLTYIWVFS